MAKSDTENLVYLRDGEVVLYKRPESDRWQARFKLPDNTWHRISTKRGNLDVAKKIAGEAYDRARFRHDDGLSAVSRRFRDVALVTVKVMEKSIDAGQGKASYRDYIQAINKYLIPFFGRSYIDKVAQDDLAKFDAWRIEKMGKVPTASTLNNHNSALSRIFQTAMDEGWVTKAQMPLIVNKGEKSKRRPAFTVEEWQQIKAVFGAWVEQGRTQASKNIRELLSDYVQIIANTGMRPGTEAFNLKWNQIRWHADKTGKYLLVSVKGKTGARDLIARQGCAVYFERIQSRFDDLNKVTFDELLKKKVNQYVFRMRDGTRTKNLYQSFGQFLDEHSLSADQHGEKRSLYSLRHMYATLSLIEDNVSIHQLAKQMGTSVQMLEQHYSHLTPMMVAKQLAGECFHQAKPKRVPADKLEAVKTKAKVHN